ncbi:hypothetical protein B0T10DRAFT_210760 [Thelonectria olida]|uniref:Secreted protein n=1 Tax=Thelonectria olida TaxID=1576542 RepID=A0A9P9AQK9_9HYPO|nr:hypothetical protein B0T10DRAFT_210760 [Thelonectria olida]
MEAVASDATWSWWAFLLSGVRCGEMERSEGGSAGGVLGATAGDRGVSIGERQSGELGPSRREGLMAETQFPKAMKRRRRRRRKRKRRRKVWAK